MANTVTFRAWDTVEEVERGKTGKINSFRSQRIRYALFKDWAFRYIVKEC